VRCEVGGEARILVEGVQGSGIVGFGEGEHGHVAGFPRVGVLGFGAEMFVGGAVVFLPKFEPAEHVAGEARRFG
jgi:hypothetical protein